MAKHGCIKADMTKYGHVTADINKYEYITTNETDYKHIKDNMTKYGTVMTRIISPKQENFVNEFVLVSPAVTSMYFSMFCDIGAKLPYSRLLGWLGFFV